MNRASLEIHSPGSGDGIAPSATSAFSPPRPVWPPGWCSRFIPSPPRSSARVTVIGRRRDCPAPAFPADHRRPPSPNTSIVGAPPSRKAPRSGSGIPEDLDLVERLQLRRLNRSWNACPALRRAPPPFGRLLPILPPGPFAAFLGAVVSHHPPRPARGARTVLPDLAFPGSRVHPDPLRDSRDSSPGVPRSALAPHRRPQRRGRGRLRGALEFRDGTPRHRAGAFRPRDERLARRGTAGGRPVPDPPRDRRPTSSIRSRSGVRRFRVTLPALHVLQVRRDTPPRLTWRSPAAARTSITPAPNLPPVPIEVLAADDHAVAEVRLVLTVAKGSGEGMRFREQSEILRPAPGRILQPRLRTVPRPAALGLEPGDELYLQAVALDTRRPTPNESRTETRCVILAGSLRDAQRPCGRAVRPAPHPPVLPQSAAAHSRHGTAAGRAPRRFPRRSSARAPRISASTRSCSACGTASSWARNSNPPPPAPPGRPWPWNGRPRCAVPPDRTPTAPPPSAAPSKPPTPMNPDPVRARDLRPRDRPGPVRPGGPQPRQPRSRHLLRRTPEDVPARRARRHVGGRRFPPHRPTVRRSPVRAPRAGNPQGHPAGGSALGEPGRFGASAASTGGTTVARGTRRHSRRRTGHLHAGPPRPRRHRTPPGRRRPGRSRLPSGFRRSWPHAWRTCSGARPRPNPNATCPPSSGGAPAPPCCPRPPSTRSGRPCGPSCPPPRNPRTDVASTQPGLEQRYADALTVLVLPAAMSRLPPHAAPGCSPPCRWAVLGWDAFQPRPEVPPFPGSRPPPRLPIAGSATARPSWPPQFTHLTADRVLRPGQRLTVHGRSGPDPGHARRRSRSKVPTARWLRPNFAMTEPTRPLSPSSIPPPPSRPARSPGNSGSTRPTTRSSSACTSRCRSHPGCCSSRTTPASKGPPAAVARRGGIPGDHPDPRQHRPLPRRRLGHGTDPVELDASRCAALESFDVVVAHASALDRLSPEEHQALERPATGWLLAC
jgi:hypothetical protein